MNSYNKLVHILVLIEDLYLFRSHVGGYKAYAYIDVPVGTTELMLILMYL